MDELSTSSNGPHAFGSTDELHADHPARALGSGSLVRLCTNGCPVGLFVGGLHADKHFKGPDLLLIGLLRVLCPSNLRSPSPAGLPRGPPPGSLGGCTLSRESLGLDLAVLCACQWHAFCHHPTASTVPSIGSTDPLAIDGMTLSVEGGSPVERLMTLPIRQPICGPESRFERVDPLYAYAADIKLNDALRGRDLPQRTADQGKSLVHMKKLLDSMARKLARVCSVPVVGPLLMEIPLSDLNSDWSSSPDHISLGDLLESALTDSLDIVGSMNDILHTSLLADTVYHGRATGVYSYGQSPQGDMARSSWLYAKLRESQNVRFQAMKVRVAASPRRPLAEAIANEPVVQFAVASALQDQPALTAMFAAKHVRVLAAQRIASSEQKPFLSHSPRIPTKRALPRDACESTGLDGDGRSGDEDGGN